MAQTVEIVNIKLAPGVTDKAFQEQNKIMETEFLSKLPGFINRETVRAEDGTYAVILHWERAEDAQASMDKFAATPDTKKFTDLLDMNAFVMTRYTVVDQLGFG